MCSVYQKVCNGFCSMKHHHRVKQQVIGNPRMVKIPLVLKFKLMPFQQTDDQQVRTAVTDATVHITKFFMKEFLITEKLNVCWVCQQMTSVLKKTVFSSGIMRLVPSLYNFSGLYFICLYLALYQRTKKSKTLFFTPIYSYSFMSLRR